MSNSFKEVTHLEDILVSAHSHLRQIARQKGIPWDAIDDIVQETCVEALQSLHIQRESIYFRAWLDGICRNVCLRWFARHARLQSRERLWSLQWLYGEPEEALDIADERIPDAVDTIMHEDLRLLLGRALSQLSRDQRRLIELCYVTDVPQREAALELGITVSAVESRLYRARRALRQILSTSEIQNYADDLGLTLDKQVTTEWQEARVRCRLCGYHLLQGELKTREDGNVHLRTLCPNCGVSRNSGGLLPLHGYKTLQPALKQAKRWMISSLVPKMSGGWHYCPWCGHFGQMVGVSATSEASNFPLSIDLSCSACGVQVSSDVLKLVDRHPEIQLFFLQHPHWMFEAQQSVQVNGIDAYALCLRDTKKAACLTIYLEQQLLAVIATVQEG